MKRISSACLSQTIRFEGFTLGEAQKEYELYLHRLDQNKVQYHVDDVQDDGKGIVTIKIRKQYNAYSMEGYLD